MPNARKRLRSLDLIETPDVWHRATTLEPGDESVDRGFGDPRRTRQRIVAGLVGFAVFLAAGAFAWQAFRMSPTQPLASPLGPLDGSLLWPERTGADLAATQERLDGGDASLAWRLDPKEVATRFAEDVLGWGEPDGRYVVSISVNWGPTGSPIEASLDRIPPPCAPPPPEGVSPCPYPFEGEVLTLQQSTDRQPTASIDPAGGSIWVVTAVRASDLKLDVEQGATVEAGATLSGHLALPDPMASVWDFSAAAGMTAGADLSCSSTIGNPAGSGGLSMEVPTPVDESGVSCGPQLAGYAWIAASQGMQATDPGTMDPLTAGPEQVLYGLTAVPMLVTTEVASPTDATTTTIPSAPSTSTEGPSTTDLVSSVQLKDGSIECTATFPREVVQPGRDTGVTFVETNVSDGPVDVGIGVNGDAGWVLITSGGQQVVDTSVEHFGIMGPPPFEKSLAPGEATPIYTEDIPVIWPGPLDVTPVCMGQKMPPVHLEVASPGATSPDAAVDAALIDTGGAFDSCRPTADRSWVTGTAQTTRDFSSDTVTFDARCAAWIQATPGFNVVVLAIVAPPDAAHVNLAELPSAIQAVPQVASQSDAPIAVSWWVYVVTTDGAVRVGQHSVALCGGSSGYGGGVASCG
jgi:hypothetical protein